MIPDLELECIANLDILNHIMIHDIIGVILDVDNTLTSYHKDVFYNQAIEFKVDKIKDKFKTLLISNSPIERMNKLEDHFGIPAINSEKRKPHPDPFQKALDYFLVEPSEIAIIDDRILSGIVGGNRAGFYTIKVPPLDIKSEPLNIRFARRFEEALLRFYLH